MSTAIQFAVLGFGVSAAYTLLAQGIVLIYRGSRVLNFAHGAFALLGAYIYFEGVERSGWSSLWSTLVAVAACVVIGGGLYLCVMRPLRQASAVNRAIATLGVLIGIQGAAVLIWGSFPQSVPTFLPVHVWHIGIVAISTDRLILLAIAAFLTLVLWVSGKYTSIGLALRAMAENQIAASALGWSPDALGTMTWAIGCGLAGLAGVLIAPLTAISTTDMPLLVIPVMAAALVGRLSSFPLTFVASLAIGIAQSELANYATNLPGLTTALPFVVIIVILVVAGRGLPVRAFVAERLPRLGSGQVRLGVVLPCALAIGALIIWVFSADLLNALTVTFGWSIVMLSLVVVLGYAGQLSLAQAVLAGVAAFFAGHLVGDLGWPFLGALPVAVVGTVVVGIAVSIPALRTRGTDLAVVTLGVGVAISTIVFTDGALTGGIYGLSTGSPGIFGLSINPITHANRYALVVFVVFVICAIVTVNIRRGVVGLRLIAIRTNERAAAALGVNVLLAKTFAFAAAAGMAALGGVLLAFQTPSVIFDDFSPLQSILVVAYVVAGGVGYVMGAPLGATLVAGGIGSWILDQFFQNPNPAWLTVIGGISLIILILTNPDGMAGEQARQARWVGARVRAALGREVSAAEPRRPAERTARVLPATLDVQGITVRFGGVTAVRDISVRVSPGQVVGLIGPNGAGKTTLIDAISGFVRSTAGTVSVDGTGIDRWPAHRRVRRGLARSFQSLELLEGETVLDNIRAACDPGRGTSYLRGLFVPSATPITGPAWAAIRELDLIEHLDEVVRDMPYGRRRLVAIARAVAASPSILMLDEPAAGLSEPERGELRHIVSRLAAEWGMGILLIEHDMSFVMDVCDEVLVLNFGEELATGSPESIRVNPAVVSAYLGTDDGDYVPADAGDVLDNQSSATTG